MSAMLAASLGACTEGPAFQETAASRAAIPAGKGRIAVLRTQQVMGFGVRPDVLVDGLPTGKCEVGSVFYVNVAPGQHTVSASTMETSVVRVNVAQGETAYVQCTIVPGALMGVPQLSPISAQSAVPQLNELVFTGQF